MDSQTNKLYELQIKNLLDLMLDKSIEGDFKAVRKAAKQINKLAQKYQSEQ